MPDYRELVEKWHKKARTSAKNYDYFAAFTFEYLSFIACLKTVLHPRTDGRRYEDRKAIQALKQDTSTKQAYLDLIEQQNGLRDSWITIQTRLNTEARLGTNSRNPFVTEEVEWWNCPHNELSMKTPAERAEIKGIIRSLEDWDNFIEFIYTVRNNLFHGTKHPEEERDLFVVTQGYKVMAPLVEAMLATSSNQA